MLDEWRKGGNCNLNDIIAALDVVGQRALAEELQANGVTVTVSCVCVCVIMYLSHSMFFCSGVMQAKAVSLMFLCKDLSICARAD